MASALNRLISCKHQITIFTNVSIRCMSLKVIRKVKIPYVEKNYKSSRNILAARGFLRNYKPYEPPEDAKDRILSICTRLNVDANLNAPLSDPAVRFSVLNECFKEFNHSVPNSLLHQVHTMGDVFDFYNTPVDLTTPYDALKKMELPKNMYVQPDYVRFHPDTDTVFGGISAFPGQSTIVTGLKARKKYQGYSVEPLSKYH